MSEADEEDARRFICHDDPLNTICYHESVSTVCSGDKNVVCMKEIYESICELFEGVTIEEAPTLIHTRLE